MDFHAPDMNWSAFFCSAVEERIEEIESVWRDLSRPEADDAFIARRLTTPTDFVLDRKRDEGAYEGYLLAKHKLGKATLRAIGTVDLWPPEHIGKPPLVSDTDQFKRLIESAQRNGVVDPKFDEDDEEPWGIPNPAWVAFPRMDSGAWPSQNPLWDACAVISSSLWPETIRPRRAESPPNFTEFYLPTLLELHKRERAPIHNPQGQASTRDEAEPIDIAHIWTIPIANDEAACDIRIVDPVDEAVWHTVAAGTPFAEIYADWGGLRKDVGSWHDPQAIAWARGFLDSARSIWRRVSTRLDG
tara:strand:- start:561 stop:1463 length:903 start_codon:yes stop_codon:yes gene_type:complete